MRDRWWRLLLLVVGVVVGFGSVAGTLAQESTPTAVATPASGTPTSVTGPTTVHVFDSPSAQLLADTYAPIAWLTDQQQACDTVGEPYLPVSVDAVLNAPGVTLRREKLGGEETDPVVKEAPSAQDLVNTDPTYYLDLPGNALAPGCDYEEWGNQRVQELGLQPSVYARVVTETGRPGELAVQYYFYWIFNDFVDNHESDWEMVQVVFNADTPEQALAQEPDHVVFAQHAGGERADWDDTKLERDGNHLIVFPASGSHASYYGEATWIGWGANGAGFGCDRANPDFREVPVAAILVPATIDPNGSFAWALFKGRWGERHAWVYNAPKGPNITKRWTHPISWANHVRSRSLPIPATSTLGPGPSSVFCSIAATSGQIMKVFPQDPQIVVWTTIAIMIALIVVSFLTWGYLKQAVALYVRHVLTFLGISLLVIPVAGGAGWLQDRIASLTVSIGSVDLGEYIASSASLTFQVILVMLITPPVVHATEEARRGEHLSLIRSIRATASMIPRVALATIWNALILFLLTFTIIGIPFALYRGVQWAYAPQAIVLDGAGIRRSRHVSRNVIKGDWLRTLGMASLHYFVVAVPGPVIGIVLIVIGVSIPVAGIVSSLLYAVMYPITIITLTLYYLHRKDVKAERVAQGLPGDSPGQGVWIRLRHPFSWRNRRNPAPATPDAMPVPGASPASS